MAKFVYRMQNILNVKEKLETQAQNEFAVAVRRLREEEDKLEVLQQRRDGYESELKELYNDNLELSVIKECSDALEVIKYHINMQAIQVKVAEQNLEAKRVALQAAMVERKTHDKLKERQFEEFVAEQAAAENKEIDEIVSYRHTIKEES